MKILRQMNPKILLSTIFALISACQAFGDRLPSKLESLTEKYERAIERATKPITLKYIDELRKLKLELTRAGDLSGALAVDETLKKLGVVDSDLASVLTNRFWTYTNDANGKKSGVKFNADGTATLTTGAHRESWKWKVTDDLKLDVTYADGNGCIFEFKNLKKLYAKGKTKNGGGARSIEAVED